MTRNSKDSIIAACLTALVTLVLLLWLFFSSLSSGRALLAQESTPEIVPITETFLEPELLRDLGEEESVVKDAPAPAEKGLPDPAPVENLKKSEPAPEPKPEKKPEAERRLKSEKPAPVKEAEPSASAEEKKRVTSAVAGGFAATNGTPSGSSGSSGAGGVGIGMSGVASGRSFLGCSRPSVKLRNKVRVTVDVIIDASGHVTSATARAGADASIRRACEQAARSARWSEKAGAPPTKGTITFNITPN